MRLGGGWGEARVWGQQGRPFSAPGADGRGVGVYLGKSHSPQSAALHPRLQT